MEPIKLLDTVASSAQAKAFAKRLKDEKKKNVKLDGLMGSSAALLFASTYHKLQEEFPTTIAILNDQDEAGYFFHDIAQMLGEENVLFFPSSYKRAIKYNQKDAANEILRTEVLTKITSTQRPCIIVSYPDALAEKVISKSELTDKTLPIEVGDCHDISTLEKEIFELGFEHVDYVYEPGQFAVRGSIIDVYSFSSDLPYRIDFFGDEVDSIRSFDIQSQLSQERVTEMTIVPEISKSKDSYISFLEFFPKQAIIATKNLAYVCDRVEKIHEEGFSMQAQFEADANNEALVEHLITDAEDFKRQILDFRCVEFKNAKTEEKDSIHFDTSPQPSFHKNFELTTSEFQRLTSEGYKLCILADSEKQIKRLEDIFCIDNENESDNFRKSGIRFDSVNRTIHEGYIDNIAKRCYFTDHQIFDRLHKYNLKSDKVRKGKAVMTLKEIMQFEVGDYVVHIDHGIGRFGGLVRVTENDTTQEKIKILYENGGAIYVSIHALHKVSKYKGKDGEPPRMSKLGSGAWERMKEKVKSKVKDIARDLILLYAKRKKEKGFAYSKDGYMQHELEASFMYEDTPDQMRATQDVKEDMEKQRPMDRLVCGDVGLGKTEVAIRAAFKAATDGKQVAVLVPTTVLAYQHYRTFASRLKDFPVTIDYLSRAKDAKKTKKALEDLASGKTDIVIGTHKLIGKDVKFKDLGLLIIDEEQKFGVAVKEKLRQMKVNVDTLTMTATPIPRTLQFSLLGARDLSIIQTPPPNRHPIQTEIHTFSPEIFAEAINFEMSRNGQVFIVNNKISNLGTLRDMIKESVPDARVCIGHGQMNPKELEQIVLDFMNYDYDVMLSTTIVENGIDVPNANTIIINSAQNYGLSDIHQMRGRVGRGNRKAFCYLIAPPLAALNEITRRRLQAVENFSDLGSGIHIAMQDLDIRGAGNMLGAEQSGFITDLGYETYQKILNEAVAELKEDEFSDIFEEENKDENGKLVGDKFVTESTIDSDLPAFLPEEYVPNSGERMSLYRELDAFTSQQQLEGFRNRLIDRFGTLPPEGEELMKVMPIKWIARNLGIEKVVVKRGGMILYFTTDQKYFESAAFGKVLTYMGNSGRRTVFREGDRPSILVKNIASMSDALSVLSEIDEK